MIMAKVVSFHLPPPSYLLHLCTALCFWVMAPCMWIALVRPLQCLVSNLGLAGENSSRKLEGGERTFFLVLPLLPLGPLQQMCPSRPQLQLSLDSGNMMSCLCLFNPRDGNGFPLLLVSSVPTSIVGVNSVHTSLIYFTKVSSYKSQINSAS